MNAKQLLGLVGSIILFIGVFAPIASVPIIGNMNYFQNGKGDGLIVLILSIISLVLVLIKKYKGLWFTGIASLGIMLFTFINFQLKISQVKADMELELADNPFRGLADAAMQSVQLQWGFALLVVGAALVIASAAMTVEKKRDAALAQESQTPVNSIGNTSYANLPKPINSSDGKIQCANPNCGRLLISRNNFCPHCGTEHQRA